MILKIIILLEYSTTTGFQWGHLKNGPYTYTISIHNNIYNSRGTNFDHSTALNIFC